jgi:hypothetical protein
MKKANIDDDYFANDKNESGDKNSKQNLNSKKGKKKKGEDFLEYAVKNGIQVNIEYEDKSAKHQEKNYEHKGNKGKFTNNFEKDKKEEFQKPNYSENNYKKYPKPYHPYKKNYHGNKMRDLHKIGNNKFDLCNPHMPRSMNMHVPMYGSYMQGAGMGMVPPMKVANQCENEIRLKDNSDESILEFVKLYLSADNLNRDLYLRNRMDENGFIDVFDVANHKKLKYMGVTVEKLIEILKQNLDNSIIETRFDEERVSLRNREWDNIKDSLNNVTQIYEQKKIARKNAYHNSLNNMNYVGMQNNYFFNSVPNSSPDELQIKMMGNYPMMMGFPGYNAYHGYQYPMMANNYVVPSYNFEENETKPSQEN